MLDSKSLYRFIFLYSIILFSDLFAQDEIPDLITDRPDITESASIIYPGWLQIETGFSLLKDNSINNGTINDLGIYNLGGTLFRYGISESVELRAGGSYRLFKSNDGVDDFETSGLSDILIGTKVSLIKDEPNQPKLSVLFHLFLPFGKRFFRSETVEPQIILSSFNNLGNNFTLSYNAGGRWNFKDDLSSYILSLSGGFSLIGNLNGYAEVFGEFSNVLNPGYFFDDGFTYLPAESFQLDASAGFGILDNSSLWFISTGLTVRIPR